MNNENEIKEELNEKLNEDIKEELKENDFVLEEEIETIEAIDEKSDESKKIDDGTMIKENNGTSEKWFDRAVSRKFMATALAVAVLLNAALSAGIMAAFAKSNKSLAYAPNETPESQSEQFFDNGARGYRGGDKGGRSGMMPPGGEQNMGAAPDMKGKNNSGSLQDSSNAPQQEQQSRASIGIVIKEDSGVVISQITGANAKKAGFQEGDKITSLEGTKVSSSSDLISALSSHKTGDTVSVGIERSGQAMEIKTVLE